MQLETSFQESILRFPCKGNRPLNPVSCCCDLFSEVGWVLTPLL